MQTITLSVYVTKYKSTWKRTIELYKASHVDFPQGRGRKSPVGTQLKMCANPDAKACHFMSKLEITYLSFSLCGREPLFLP